MNQRINVSDRVYQQIKQDILLGVLDFGDSIIEQDYANKINVSRTPIREALKKLEVEGIISRLPNGRIKIIELDTHQIVEIYEIRVALENVILEHSINNENIPKKLDKILKINKREIEQQEWEEARSTIVEFSREMLGDPRYQFSLKILEQYNFFIAKLKQRSLTTVERILQVYEDHSQMLEYIKQKDIVSLQQLNKKHLMTACDTILEQIKE